MADSTVAALPAATALTGAELFYGVQSSADVKITGTQIQTFTGGALTVGVSTITSGTTTRLLYDNAAVLGEALLRYSAANLFLGDVDAASPVAQTLTVQSVSTGTSNTAGADWTIAGSKGTGTGAGGSILFKTAPLGGSGTSQNALATAFTINSVKQLSGTLNSITIPSFTSDNDLTSGITPRNAELDFIVSGSRVAYFDAVGLTFTGNLFAQDSTYIRFGSGETKITCSSTAGLFHFGAVDANPALPQQFETQSVVAGTSDTAGQNFTFNGSRGTGTAASGNTIEKTGFSAKSTGSSQHTLVDRQIIVAKGKVLTDATPVSLFEIALPTLTMCGGQIEATVVCTNGTDMQSFTQTITYSAVNKGGVYTKSITASTGDKSVSGGSTIANTWSLLDGTNKVTVQLSSDTSLAPSSNAFLCYYSVKNNSEQATTIL